MRRVADDWTAGKDLPVIEVELHREVSSGIPYFLFQNGNTGQSFMVACEYCPHRYSVIEVGTVDIRLPLDKNIVFVCSECRCISGNDKVRIVDKRGF